MPDYTRDELVNWAMSQQLFHDIYDGWVKSGFEKMKVPSFDRINDYEPYSLDNIVIKTWMENKEKWHDDSKSGKSNKLGKPVVQLDINGVFINEFHSLRFAAKEVNGQSIHISRCCRGKQNTSYGFLWKYKSEYIKQ